MHTLFTLEDLYGLTVSKTDGAVCLKFNKKEYDHWRCHYPKFDIIQRWAKVPSQEPSDALVEMFKGLPKPDK